MRSGPPETFNSLFGILELLPVGREHWQGYLSTPFSGFFDVGSLDGRRGKVFQLPFRDSYLLSDDPYMALSFNSLFGIQIELPLVKGSAIITFNSLFGIPSKAN